jgi:hypothetical protein
MTPILADLRYAWRIPLRTPGFVPVSVVSRAIGIARRAARIDPLVALRSEG